MIGPDGKPMDADGKEKDLKDEFSLEQYCQIMGNMALSPDIIIQYVIGRKRKIFILLYKNIIYFIIFFSLSSIFY